MPTKKPVQPNFLKALTISLFMFSSATALAGQQPKDEKIVELKEMTTQQEVDVNDTATPLTDADTEAAEDAFADEIDATAKEMAEEPDAIADE